MPLGRVKHEQARGSRQLATGQKPTETQARREKAVCRAQVGTGERKLEVPRPPAPAPSTPPSPETSKVSSLHT